MKHRKCGYLIQGNKSSENIKTVSYSSSPRNLALEIYNKTLKKKKTFLPEDLSGLIVKFL